MIAMILSGCWLRRSKPIGPWHWLVALAVVLLVLLRDAV